MSDDFRTNVEKLIVALVTPTQSVEDALQQLLSERSVDTAVGDQLDTIGVIVDQPRAGLDDETYRRYIRARIRTHRSNGIMRDILAVADLVIYDDDAYLRILNQGVAAYVLRVEDFVMDTDLVNVVIKFLRDATSAGVRPILETWPLEEDELFSFDGGNSW